MIHIKKCLVLFWAASILYACNSNPETKNTNKDTTTSAFTFTVEQAPEWTRLFKRNHGWFGGDGIFSIALSGTEKTATGEDDIMLWFSDTLLGDVINDSLQDGNVMINNSVLLLKGASPDSTNARFYWDTLKGKAASIVEPKTAATQPGEYYWLGDGFVNTELNNDIYLFGYRIKNIPEKAVFGFKQVGSTLIKIPAGEKPPFKGKTQMDIPFFQGLDADSAGSFGAGVLVNTQKAGAPAPDGFVYVYGIRGKNKEVLVARVKAEQVEQFDQWTFWNGKSWSNDLKGIQPVTDGASNELSVTPLKDGRYVMVFQKNGIDPKVGLRVGDSPVGPFGAVVDVYDTKDDLKQSPQTLFSYNAKAHPVLSKPGELLISYNVNSFDYNNDIKRFPHLYRPRFIKLKYQ